MYVVALPIASVSRFSNSNVGTNNLTYGACVLGGDDDITGNFGTITVIAVPQGSRWYGGALNGTANNVWSSNVAIAPAVNLHVPTRIVAGGFEVHDTTPEMFKGGACTVFDNGVDAQSYFGAYRKLSAQTPEKTTLTMSRAPPSSVDEMARHPDSRSWEASEGCYCRLVLDLDDTAYRMGQRCDVLAFNAGGIAPAAEASTSSGYTVLDSVLVRAGLGVTIAAFTGLNEEASFSLSTVIYTEAAPMFDSNELALASPSAPYDPEVLELYRNVACHLPPGVPVGMNPKGEWWGMVVQSVGKAVQLATPLLKTIPEVGIPLSMLGNAGGAYLEQKGKDIRAKAKAKKTNPPSMQMGVKKK